MKGNEYCKNRRIRILLLVTTGLVLLLFMSNSFAFRCGTHLIREGDLSLMVKKYCGEPDWIDRWYDKIVIGEGTYFEHSLDNINERWVYNFGPQQFIRYLTIRNNRVISIETGKHGFNMPDTGGHCDTGSFRLGMSSGEVAAKCGQPDSQSRSYEMITQPIGPGAKGQATIPVDEWIYNLGPQYFVRILTFRNGELINIETGERGF